MTPLAASAPPPRTHTIPMELDTKTPPYRTNDTKSFAYISGRDRWPVILTQAIDDVFRTTRNETDPVRVSEGKTIVATLSTLKYELQHDRKLIPLEDDGHLDIAQYNEELAALGTPSWFNIPWLYAECYLYRRMHTAFVLSTTWKTYDPFRAQKLSTFKSSRTAVVELAARYRQITAPTTEPLSQDAQQLLFAEMFEICLWGNATDLSLLTSVSYEALQSLQGSAARKASEANIIVNDLPRVFDVLSAAQAAGQAQRRIDIVLDNAGFELFVDLVLAGYLLHTGLATTVVLHPKRLPWFVSDVIPADFADLLNALKDARTFYSTAGDELPDAAAEDLAALFEAWSGYHAEGRLLLRPHAFWTLPGSYWRLPAEKDLWEDLRTSDCVVFKGDLNYRKLTGDAEWAPETPFADAIGPLAGKDGKGGIRCLALRTCKADVVVGLPPGKDEELRGGEWPRKWAWSGKYAVVSFWDGKAAE